MCQVAYKNKFEPYVLMRTDCQYRFDERLLERMEDKALYIRTLHAAGYAYLYSTFNRQEDKSKIRRDNNKNNRLLR